MAVRDGVERGEKRRRDMMKKRKNEAMKGRREERADFLSLPSFRPLFPFAHFFAVSRGTEGGGGKEGVALRKIASK